MYNILVLFSDSTAQYIQGEVGIESRGLVDEGLQCVSVLIGVYDRSTGLPIIGVTNQPFYKHEGSRCVIIFCFSFNSAEFKCS